MNMIIMIPLKNNNGSKDIVNTDLRESKDFFINLSNNALSKARLYDAEHMVDSIANIL